MIEVHGLVKRYGGKTAVNGLTFTVQPGVVTGLPGAERGGQVDHDARDRGPGPAHRRAAASVNGRAYDRWPRPAGRGRRPAGGQGDPPGPLRLQPPAARWRPTHGIGRAAGWTRSWTWSGWRRWPANGPAGSRWAWASGWASPRRCWPTREMLMLDEPVNGLDPEGVRWVRNLLKDLAARGPHRVRLQPPDERDGADRRPPDRDRPRRADRGYLGDRVHRSVPRSAACGCAPRRRPGCADLHRQRRT